jgi:hypothetical protein
MLAERDNPDDEAAGLLPLRDENRQVRRTVFTDSAPSSSSSKLLLCDEGLSWTVQGQLADFQILP